MQRRGGAPPNAIVGSYRLSKLARDQLLSIFDFTDAKFGRYQAEAYYAGLERSFGLIADFPGRSAPLRNRHSPKTSNDLPAANWTSHAMETGRQR